MRSTGRSARWRGCSAEPTRKETRAMTSMRFPGESDEYRRVRDELLQAEIERIRGHARSRGWGHLRLLSSAKSSYHPDYHGEAADGSQLPMMNVFTKSDGEVRHFYASEALFAGSEPGQDPRHLDLMWPL